MQRVGKNYNAALCNAFKKKVKIQSNIHMNIAMPLTGSALND